MHPRVWLLPFLLGGCEVETYQPAMDTGEPLDSGTFAVDAAGDADDGGPGGGAPADDPDRPVVLDADAWCYLHETGDTRWIWAATATVDDPQGLATINHMTTNGIQAFADGALHTTLALVCDPDGRCTASWGAEPEAMDCGRPEDFTLVFTVLDEDGKRSVPVEVIGRLGSDAEG